MNEVNIAYFKVRDILYYPHDALPKHYRRVRIFLPESVITIIVSDEAGESCEIYEYREFLRIYIGGRMMLVKKFIYLEARSDEEEGCKVEVL